MSLTAVFRKCPTGHRRAYKSSELIWFMCSCKGAHGCLLRFDSTLPNRLLTKGFGTLRWAPALWTENEEWPPFDDCAARGFVVVGLSWPESDFVNSLLTDRRCEPVRRPRLGGHLRGRIAGPGGVRSPGRLP